MNRGTWLKARREELKYANKDTASEYSLRAVADYAGISSAGLSHLERTDAMPTLDLAMKLAEYYDRSLEWVLNGKDTSSDDGIPVVGTITNGPSQEYLEHGLRFPREYQYINLPTNKRRKFYALRIDDEASSPAYRPGDIAIFDLIAPPMLGEDHLVKFRNGGTVSELLLLVTERGDEYVFNSVKDPHRRLIKNKDEVLYIHPVYAVAKPSALKKF